MKLIAMTIFSASDQGLRISRATFIVAAISLNSFFVFWVYPQLFHSAGSGYQFAQFHDYYNVIARHLLEGYGFRLSPDTAETMVRGPAYILFLAGVFYVFGESIFVAQIFNVVFIGIASLFLYHLVQDAGFKRISPLVAPTAVLLFISHPMIIGVELRGDPLSFFTMLCVLVAFLVQRALLRRHLRYFFLAGVVLAIAALTRGTAVVMGAGVGLLFVGSMFWNPDRGRLLRHIAAFVLVGILVLFPWILRNYLISGSFVPLATVSGDAMFQGMYVNRHMGFAGQHGAVILEASQRQEEMLQLRGVDFLPGFVQKFFDARSEVEHSRRLQGLVIDTYMTEPGFAVKSILYNLVRFWNQGRSTSVTLLYTLVQLPFVLLALWGWALAVRYRVPTLVVVVSVPLTIWLAHAVTIAHAKHSTATLPFLSIFAAVSLLQLVRSSRRAIIRSRGGPTDSAQAT